ncbi:hypothetical protein HYPSUDRAFT_51784 [Hypholoma sublateritium FD-334 SS-4]|uniref:CUE domain-containing protein n=1 Tax=Hypholoma sublateritium (strain FD-334 SS-4) TaxID=945553 RepID=A0A0D2PH49_HYPSF|nr:hypothetical protein HYPSUDRAFT_51784 [Hypholoma sublateritium FD-334 SS-4]
MPSASPPTSNTSGFPPPQPTPQHERETVNDPGVISLRGMFPDYDDLILQSVLQSVSGNQERAIDALLGMSDPDYRSEAPATEAVTPQLPVTLTQEELDEQFARQLVLSEQQQQTEQWMQTQAGGRVRPAVYQPTRQNAQQGWNPQTSGEQERPSEFQDQFNKIAETGKKTIGSIFSKVKAKLQEFETGRPVAGTSGAQQQGWAPPPAGAGVGGYGSPPLTQSQQYHAAYYDPNPPQLPTRAPVVEGYDVTPRQPSPQPVTVPPPQIGTTLDGGKLGLLPKRPVTLLREPSVPATGTSAVSHDDYDDDGLEYAENPFESEPSGAKK